MYFLVEKIGGEITDKYFDEEEKAYAKTAQWIEAKDTGKLKFYNPIDNEKLIKQAFYEYNNSAI